MSLSARQKEILSGLSGGAVSTIICHPLDVIKIRLQLSAKSGYLSFNSVVSDLFVSNSSSFSANFSASLKNLYRGLPINVIGNATSWSLYFALYLEIKSVSGEISQFNYMTSSIAAGMLTSLVTNPIWVLKTRLLSTNKNAPVAYKSTAQAIYHLACKESASTWFKGFTPSMFAVFQGSLHMTIYDTMKHRYRQDGPLSVFQYLCFTSTAKVVSMTAFYPFQVLKARLQSYNASANLPEVIREIYTKEGGFRGFYKGIYINLFRSLPATCVTFLTYETSKTWFGP